MRIGFILLVVAAAAAMAVPVDYLAPVASGYIYRSDNNGPPSLIQLGSVSFQQPHAFAPPLSLAQPLKLQAIEAYDLAPVPLPYVAAKPIVVEDAEEDEDNKDDDESEEYLDGGDVVHHQGDLGHDTDHSFEKGAGREYGEEHHAAHGEKGGKGYSSRDYHAEGEAGHYGKEHNEGFYSDAEDEKKSHLDEEDAHGKHYEAGDKYTGGDHGHKKHFSKGEDITGYHKVFHKDEYKKDHDFYDVADNSGHFKKYGHANEKHGSAEGGLKEEGHHDAASDKGEFGKAGFHAKGHVDESNESHSAEEGQDSHYNQGQDYSKKSGRFHEKDYEFDDDDEED